MKDWKSFLFRFWFWPSKSERHFVRSFVRSLTDRTTLENFWHYFRKKKHKANEFRLCLFRPFFELGTHEWVLMVATGGGGCDVGWNDLSGFGKNRYEYFVLCICLTRFQFHLFFSFFSLYIQLRISFNDTFSD